MRRNVRKVAPSDDRDTLEFWLQRFPIAAKRRDCRFSSCKNNVLKQLEMVTGKKTVSRLVSREPALYCNGIKRNSGPCLVS